VKSLLLKQKFFGLGNGTAHGFFQCSVPLPCPIILLGCGLSKLGEHIEIYKIARRDTIENAFGRKIGLDLMAWRKTQNNLLKVNSLQKSKEFLTTKTRRHKEKSLVPSCLGGKIWLRLVRVGER
jgi:hypothetical protein